MKKVKELLNAPENVRFLNDQARAHWALEHGVNREFILVETPQHFAHDLHLQIFTQEAFELIKPHLLVTHTAQSIGPVTAAGLQDWVWTCEDVVTYLASRAAP